MKKVYDQRTFNYDSVIDELSQAYINKAKEENINIDEDPKTLKNTIDMDIRENIPPQLLSIVSGVVKIIESLEKGD
jgi:type III secretion system FlhB-like substrate exporter